MQKKDSKQPGMDLPAENQDPFLEQKLPGAKKQRPHGPGIPGKEEPPGEEKNDNNSENQEPVDERSGNL